MRMIANTVTHVSNIEYDLKSERADYVGVFEKLNLQEFLGKIGCQYLRHVLIRAERQLPSYLQTRVYVYGSFMVDPRSLIRTRILENIQRRKCSMLRCPSCHVPTVDFIRSHTVGPLQ